MLAQLFPIPSVPPPGLPSETPDEPEERDFICHPISFPGAITGVECRRIVELAERGTRVTAGLTRPVEGYRNGINKIIALTGESRWLYQRISDVLVGVNQWYRFDITGFVDCLLYCVYPEGGHFDWHLDCSEGATSTRKISISVQLSDASEYDGGALEFATHGELRDARRLGTAVSFPAFLHHRVAPVTRGMRRSLVAWAHGPAFR